MKPILTFADGNQLLDVDADTFIGDACETCGYREDITEVYIKTTNQRLVYKLLNFDLARLVRVFAIELSKFTENEFIKYLEENLGSEGDSL